MRSRARLDRDEENDVASLIVDGIRDGEVNRDVGPHSTPTRQWITMSYDREALP